MGIFGKRAGRKWPTLDIYGNAARGDIKTATVDKLAGLMAKAAAGPWSAVGRPEWFGQHRDGVSRILLVVFGTEEPSAYRALVTVILEDSSGGSFTLDLAVDDFDDLPDVGTEALVTLAHRYLLTFPPIDLDPEQ